MENIKNEEAWNELFSSLAFAEKAAADECKKIARHFRENGLNRLADEYEGLFIEENRHHELALSVTKKVVPLTKRALVVYEGGFFTKDATILERLMSVHFVFEPSALAFLGYVSRHSEELFTDREWAKRITSAFNQILRDEVSHVLNGSKVIQQHWNAATTAERKVALRTMRKHRAFLKAGLKSFFKNTSAENHALPQMLNRFDYYFEKELKGVLHAEPTQVAS